MWNAAQRAFLQFVCIFCRPAIEYQKQIGQPIPLLVVLDSGSEIEPIYAVKNAEMHAGELRESPYRAAGL